MAEIFENLLKTLEELGPIPNPSRILVTDCREICTEDILCAEHPDFTYYIIHTSLWYSLVSRLESKMEVQRIQSGYGGYMGIPVLFPDEKFVRTVLMETVKHQLEKDREKLDPFAFQRDERMEWKLHPTYRLFPP